LYTVPTTTTTLFLLLLYLSAVLIQVIGDSISLCPGDLDGVLEYKPIDTVSTWGGSKRAHIVPELLVDREEGVEVKRTSDGGTTFCQRGVAM